MEWSLAKQLFEPNLLIPGRKPVGQVVVNRQDFYGSKLILAWLFNKHYGFNELVRGLRPTSITGGAVLHPNGVNLPAGNPGAQIKYPHTDIGRDVTIVVRLTQRGRQTGNSWYEGIFSKFYTSFAQPYYVHRLTQRSPTSDQIVYATNSAPTAGAAVVHESSPTHSQNKPYTLVGGRDEDEIYLWYAHDTDPWDKATISGLGADFTNYNTPWIIGHDIGIVSSFKAFIGVIEYIYVFDGWLGDVRLERLRVDPYRLFRLNTPDPALKPSEAPAGGGLIPSLSNRIKLQHLLVR